MELPGGNISLLDEVVIQAQVIRPILDTLQKEYGNERAMEIIKEALHGWHEDYYSKQAQMIDGDSLKKWMEMNALLMKRVGSLEMEWLKQDKTTFIFNVIKCKYAEYFKGIDEVELGTILCCELDNHIARAAGPGIEFQRTQTIMNGARHCDFHYRINNS